MNIGYIRSYNFNDKVSVATQKMMLERFSKTVMMLDKIIIESSYKLLWFDPKCHNYVVTESGYQSRYKGDKIYPELDSIAALISKGEIDNIIVDTRLRLKVNPEYNRFFERLCRDNHVQIYEVNGVNEILLGSAIICHSTTDGIEFGEPTLKNIDDLYVHCKDMGLEVDRLYVVEGDQQYNAIPERALKKLSKGQVILAYDFMRISRNSGPFIRIVKTVYGKGASISTVRNGSYVFSDDKSILTEGMTAFFYDAYSREVADMEFELEKVKLFVDLKTNWKLQGNYWTEARTCNKKHLMDFTEDINKADVIIIRGFYALNDRTQSIEETLSLLRKKQLLYSMEEGCYFYGKV